jgi:hypothetical protein
MGDASSVVLANGTFMLGPCCDNPPSDWLLDPAALTWTATGGPSAGGTSQTGQGYDLLPNGKVLTLDIWSNSYAGGATNAEAYDPVAGTWSGAGNTPVPLTDPAACGSWQIGPAVLRGDGKLIAFGGDTGCTGDVDPTAILDTGTGTWSNGPNVPSVCGSNGTTPCTLPTGSAVLLPNGNILFAAAASYGGPPTHFFEFERGTNTIQQVADAPGAPGTVDYLYNFVVLPTGQILAAGYYESQIYTPLGTPVANWAPRIGNVSKNLKRGRIYKLRGHQLNGVSQGAYQGATYQSATNFPLVRIVNNRTGRVFYANSSYFSTLSIAPRVYSLMKFTVPLSAQRGASTLYVVANGIASAGVAVTLR